MKASRLLVPMLCLMIVFGVISLVWQARIIRSLRAERAVLRQEIRTALAAGFNTVSTSVADQPERDRLELIKLRHEVRELRESLFEAMRKKVTLLQNTISLVSEISRGNQAGASRLAGG